MKRVFELAAAVFIKRLQQHGHDFCDETELLEKETTVCSFSLFSREFKIGTSTSYIL